MTMMFHSEGAAVIEIEEQPREAQPRSELAQHLDTFETVHGNELADLFRILGDVTRLKILHLLQKTPEINVRTFCELLDQSQPAVSHHLAMLKEAGILVSRRDGKNNYYRFSVRRIREYLDLFLGSPLAGAVALPVDDRVVSYQAAG